MTDAQRKKLEGLYSWLLDDIKDFEDARDRGLFKNMQERIDKAQKEADAIVQELGYTPKYVPIETPDL